MSAAGFRRAHVGIDGSNRAVDPLAKRLLKPKDGRPVPAFVEVERSFKPPQHRAAPNADAVIAAGHAQIAAGRSVTHRMRAARSIAPGLTELAAKERAHPVVVGSSNAALEGRTSRGHTALRDTPRMRLCATLDRRGRPAERRSIPSLGSRV